VLVVVYIVIGTPLYFVGVVDVSGCIAGCRPVHPCVGVADVGDLLDG